MGTKINLLAVFLVAALAFCACSDDDDKNDGITVPENISHALLQKYPSATGIEWKQKGDYYVADCRVDGKDFDVWFSKSATWQMTEVEISWNNLPPAVQTTFNNSEYARWKREDIVWLQYPTTPMQYVIEVENNHTEYQLFYAEDGGLLQKKDVTGKDDTHWPVSLI